MTCGVYKIINKVNGKFYVGCSVNIEDRWKSYQKNILKPPTRRNYKGRLCCHAHRMVEDCIQLGLDLDDFVFLILEICDRDTLLTREDFWIKRFEPEYNSKTYIDGKWIHKGQAERRGKPHPLIRSSNKRHSEKTA